MKTKYHQIKSVILDLDQTLTTDTGSWLQFTTLVGADPKKHSKIYLDFKTGKLSYKHAKSELINLWQTTGKTNRSNIEEIFDRVELRSGAYEAIEYLKSKYHLCIISGAIDLFVETFARKLGVDAYYASTRFVFDKNNKLFDFHYKLRRGEEKLGFLRDYCKSYKLRPSECAAIGDGESDMPIFESVGLPILFIASETSDDQKDKIKVHLKNWSDISKVL